MEPPVVYSTEHGRVCDRCGRPRSDCVCRSTRNGAVRGDGRIRVSRETKGRKGKGVTVVTGVPLALGDLVVLARELKQKCGSGGTVRNGVIEVQGEHRDQIVALLRDRGFAAIRSGG